MMTDPQDASPPAVTDCYPVDEFQAQLDFQLDGFQREAMETIAQGHSVVVCAPTGSGKTIVAEYAAMRALAEGRKIFYTTPLKALSNQKFHDFKRQFGEANVGLLTGDISVNRDARILVMTTEIFRNMLYGSREDSTLLGYLGYVVLDECHYMNDAERGTVWEESIIYCPENIQVVALSATVANAQELTDWIHSVHHDARLIWSDFRPVPLRFSYYDRERLLPLFDAPGKLNKQLKHDRKGDRFKKEHRFFRPNTLIRLMQERDMLPAIFFTFSRKDCDKHLEYTQRLNLLTPVERKRLNRQVDEFLAQNPFLADNQQLPFIRNGFAAHHAGLLPGMKHLVESLFQQGLIKTVFATETLAAGINMPARSTVITKISKRTNDGHRLLTASEFLQMSGRAGRRGMDDVGYVVIAASQYEGAQEAATLASSPPDPLNSQFTPTYGMVLNLLQKHTLSQAEFLVRQSFGQFTAVRRLRPLEESRAQHAQALEELLAFQCPENVSDKDFAGLERNRLKIHEASRFVRILQRQIKQHGPSPEMLRQLTHEQGKLASLRASVDALPCQSCKLLKKHQRIEERIQREQRKLKVVNRMLADEQDTYWRQFLSIYNLLKEVEYLDVQDKPTERGRLTAQVRSENEYAMAEVMMAEGLLTQVSAPALAGVMSALINDSTRDNQWVRFSLSSEAVSVLRDVELLYKRLDKIQRRHGVDVPLVLNPVASGLVEAWAQGMAWNRLIQATNIGEGDIVRLLRRTADMLRQLSRVDGVPGSLTLTAKEALKLIDREPIKEVEMPDSPQPSPDGPSSASTQLKSESAPSPPSPSDTGSSQPEASRKTAAMPDWKPLGDVRDSFYEQMKQDGFR